MDRVSRLLAVARPSAPGVGATLSRWRAAGVEVQLVSFDQPQATVQALDSARPDGIAVWGLDAELEHALSRSLRHQQTPVAVFFEGAEGLVAEGLLDRPFHLGPPVLAPASPEWDAALRRLDHDPRVRLIFRTEWHAHALAKRVGVGAFRRASVIAPGVEFRAPRKARAPLVLFPGAIDAAWRHGADLFVRTVLELSHRHGPSELRFAVLSERVREEAVLRPLAGLPLERLGTGEALARARLALVCARDGAAVNMALTCLGHGVAPLPLVHPALGELLQGQVGLADDPGAFADRVGTLLEHPSRSTAYSLGLTSALKERCAPARATRAELAGFEPPAPRRPPTVAPLLTVGVPAWNAARWLERCVTSLVRAETSGLLEIIVVDDGSTDETGALADRLARETPQLVRAVHQPNRGHGGAINTALREARGTFFRVVDADDWVDGIALAALIETLRHERADLVLTPYAEDRPAAPLPKAVDLLSRLPPGGLCRFDTILDPLFGLTSWGPLLSTSTFRTSVLRKAGLTLTEHSAYVDLEYCTLGLEFVETMRHQPLTVYRYSLDLDGQSVSPSSYQKRFRQHEAVIFRLCRFAAESRQLSSVKRAYIAERVIAPVVDAHLTILLDLLRDRREAKAFRGRMGAWPFVPVPLERASKRPGRKALKALLPEHLVRTLEASPDRAPGTVVRELGRYVLPSSITRFFAR